VIHRSKISFEGIGERIERLKEIPQSVEGIELIVLFGRLARGRRWPKQNVDVASQVANFDEIKRAQVLEATSEALGTKEVDIAFLNDDLAYRLKWHIGWKGRLLYEAKAGLFSDYKILAAAMWFDFKPLWDWQLWKRRTRKREGR